MTIEPVASQTSPTTIPTSNFVYQHALNTPFVILVVSGHLSSGERALSVCLSFHSNTSDTEANEFEQILDKHNQHGEEDQALEKRMEMKKAAAKNQATRQARRKKAQIQLDSDNE
ncbi:hypothetical protein HGRIS_011772 [Hohenbuehelia grisea]|uniref:Uncharacterized protein n=1 Tax=Hohenbuehelia grisea TaxID=104357 RepID=A0ABR3JWA6_9AGAR